jgi:adenylate cyclase class 2
MFFVNLDSKPDFFRSRFSPREIAHFKLTCHSPAHSQQAQPLLPYTRFLAMPVETEIKFRVDDLASLGQRLQSAGFHLHTPRSFESNVLYDTPDRRLRARTEILRIRHYAGHCLLTHKRLPDVGPGEDRHKHRIETETEISDGDAMAEVFLSLGLVPAFRYEKWRTEWDDGQGHCVVDETPIGDFAELEGPAQWIDQKAQPLGIDPGSYITLSYGRLFEQWRERVSSTAQDLTFAATARILANH